MTLHADLIAQARHLATLEPRRPSQASLRRAVSASYYALYHLLVDAAVRRIAPGEDRDALRACLARAFDHNQMRIVAQQFSNRNLSPKLEPSLKGKPLQKRIVRFSGTFIDLQQARHEADYDVARQFTRREALEFVGRAEKAVSDWGKVQKSLQAHTFLVGMLALQHMRS